MSGGVGVDNHTDGCVVGQVLEENVQRLQHLCVDERAAFLRQNLRGIS